MTIHGPTTRSPRPIPRNRPSDRRKPIPHTRGSRPDMGRLPFPYPRPTTRNRYIDTRTMRTIPWAGPVSEWPDGPDHPPFRYIGRKATSHRTKISTAAYDADATRNINWSIMDQLIFFATCRTCSGVYRCGCVWSHALPNPDGKDHRPPATFARERKGTFRANRDDLPNPGGTGTDPERRTPQQKERRKERRPKTRKKDTRKKNKDKKKRSQHQHKKHNKSKNTATPPPNQNQNTRKNTMRVLHLAARKPP